MEIELCLNCRRTEEWSTAPCEIQNVMDHDGMDDCQLRYMNMGNNLPASEKCVCLLFDFQSAHNS